MLNCPSDEPVDFQEELTRCITGWNKYDDPMTASQQEMRMKDHKEIVRKELAKYRHQATMDNSLQQIH